MIPVKIGGEYILTRRSIARMLATITAALMMFYASATAQAKDMVRRIYDATIALVSLDRQMIGRLAYVVVPDFMYLEDRALYLELRPFRDFHGRVPPIVRAPVVSGAAVAGRPPYPAARRDASPHHAAVTMDDLQRALEEMKLPVRKLVREARQRQENVDSPRVPRGVAGRQRRLSVTRGALRLLPQPQDRVLDHAVREDGKAAGYDFVSS